MAINSLNFAMAGSYGAYSQKLTAATRARLIELGITFNENITEAEGKRLIKQAEAQQAQTSQQTNNQQNQKSFTGGDEAQNALYQQAKRLAEQLGISVQPNEEFQTLLIKIEEALEKQVKSAENDPQKLQQLKALSRELASIQAQSQGGSGYDNTNKALMMSLEMLSQYNKTMVNM